MRQEKQRLTREQNELRVSGLRILARIVARAHLGSLAEEEAADSRASGVHARSNRLPLGKDGGHVR